MSVLQKETSIQKVVGTVIFSGDCDPDVEGAAAALSRRGFRIYCLPERLKSLLLVEGDDFMEVTIAADIDDVGALMDEVNAIVRPFGAMADSFGPLGPDHVPLEEVFGERLLCYDEEAIARRIVKRKEELARLRA